MSRKTPHPIPLAPSPRVAILVDTATTWGRGIINGIYNYSHQHGGWHLFMEARGRDERVVLSRGWRSEGIIARVGNVALAQQLQQLRIPVVNVSNIQLPGQQFPRVTNDVEAVAKMAVDYFLNRGFKHFAYLSLRGLEYVARQRNVFVKAVAAAGMQCAVHGVKADEGTQTPDWSLNIKQLGTWLRSLPKPVAILTWSGGREVIHACQHAGLRVPEEVALLSGSDDDLLCKFSHISISGIPAASEQIGMEAARLLEKLMQGKAAPASPKTISPLGVVTRQSTDTMAISDGALVAALGFIRENLAAPIQVRDVAAHAGLSRSVLERRFAAILGRSPSAYISQLRLDLVKKQLIETDLSIAEVAEVSGFGSPEYMTAVFRNQLGTTPLRYRRTVRGR